MAAAGGLLLACLAALLLVRNSVAEFVITAWLDGRVAGETTLSVEHLGWSRLVVTDLRVGRADEFVARRIEVAYRPGGLLHGDLQAVTLVEPRLRLDLTADDAPLGSLQPLVDSFARATQPAVATEPAPEAPGDPDTAQNDPGRAKTVPPITVRDGRIMALTPLGEIELTASGETWSDVREAVAASFDVGLDSPLGSLEGSLALTSEPGPVLVGNMVIDRGRLELPSASIAGLTGSLSFLIEDGRPQSVAADLALSGLDLPRRSGVAELFQEASVLLRMTDRQAWLDGEVVSRDGGLRMVVIGEADDYWTDPAIRLQLDAELAAASSLWELLGLARPESGRGRLVGRLEGRLPAITEAAEAVPEGYQWLAAGRLDGELAVQVSDLTYPGIMTGLNGQAELRGQVADGRLRIQMAEAARLGADGLDPAWLQAAGVPADLARRTGAGFAASLALAHDSEGDAVLAIAGETGAELATGLQLEVSLGGEPLIEADSRLEVRLAEPFRAQRARLRDLRVTAGPLRLAGQTVDTLALAGELTVDRDGLSGELDIEADLAGVSLADLRSGDLAFAGGILLQLTGDTLAIRVRPGGSLSMEGVAHGDRLSVAEPIVLTLADGDLRLDFGAEALQMRHRLLIDPNRITLRVARSDDEGPLTVETNIGRLQLSGQMGRDGSGYRGRVATQGAEIRLPELDAVLQEVSAAAVLGVPRQGPFADFRVGAVRHLGAPPLFTPLLVTGDVSSVEQGLRVAARVQQAESGARLDVEARIRPRDRQGRIHAELAELTFDPDGLQPASLSPVLKDLREVSGRIGARATIDLSDGEIAGDARATLADVGFATEQVRVAGLSLALTLDQLSPPGSPPGQKLTIAAIDPGVPLRDIAVTFALLPVEPPAVQIEQAALDFAGGRLLLEDTRLSASPERQEIPLQVRTLDIGLFFETLGIEGLAADGKLDGRLPLVIENKRLELRDGRLEAVAPGALSWRSDVVRNLVAQGGEAAEMVVRALENFHYDKLVITLSKTPDNEGRLSLKLEGRNPNYRDGQPFNFNINIEADLTSLLDALAQAYRLSGRAFGRALEFAK